MCPYEAMQSRPLGKFRLCDFERACELKQHTEAVPRNEDWVMSWRAKDGGLRLGELVDGGLNNYFEISMNESSTSKGIIGVKIAFHLVYNHHTFMFQESKTKNLEVEAAVPPQVLIPKWKSLEKPESEDDVSIEVLDLIVKDLKTRVNEAEVQT